MSDTLLKRIGHFIELVEISSSVSNDQRVRVMAQLFIIKGPKIQISEMDPPAGCFV